MHSDGEMIIIIMQFLYRITNGQSYELQTWWVNLMHQW